MSAKKLPELLCPAGSREAFLSAIDGGADAIYLGGTSFNARINAKNFTSDTLRECIKLAHSYGVKVYMTLNTLLFDKEREGFLSASEEAASCGIDAFIVADLGCASLLRSHIPEIPLHASTQMSVHNSQAGEFLKQNGFSRLVPARELTFSDIKELVDNNPLEVEIFTHGALCVSHSGQCLFSSIVGGRSGNRGLCAQPCRLPYSCGEKGVRSPEYPLSLKDLTLAEHIDKILLSGVHSLKIEGRMKSPEYVRAVTCVWRKLLDERRNATHEEMKALSDIFSRGGFTDGYFEGKINKSMLGVRSQYDKSLTAETKGAQTVGKITRKLPIDMEISLSEGKPALLKVSHNNITVCSEGDIVQGAINAPLSEESIRKSFSKLGDTPFEIHNMRIDIKGDVMLPVSRLNFLRREGIDKLINTLNPEKEYTFTHNLPKKSQNSRKTQKIGEFLFECQITDSAKKYFDKTFLPLERYTPRADGFVMPPVILSSELANINKMIDTAIAAGATCAYVGNIGNIKLLKNRGLEIFGSFRFNVTNSYSVKALEDLGVTNITLSPELTLPQIRDISGDVSSIVYGRLPLMTLEKCIIRDSYGCDICNSRMKDFECGKKFNFPSIRDRMGVTFPVLRVFDHRNIIYNSLPTCMSDKEVELVRANITNRLFIFTNEIPNDVDRVINAHKNHLPLNGQVRRI